MMTVHEEIEPGNLLDKVAAMPLRGYRLVTLTALDEGTHFEIYYHFDLKYQLHTMRLKVEYGATVPSISGIYFSALLVENEIQDLFGITFTDLAIDYKHHFLLADDAPVKPFCRVPGVGVAAAVRTPAVGGEK